MITIYGGMKAPYGRVGGKSKLKKLIVDDYFPKDYRDLVYVEPFVGAGSIYFYKDPSDFEIINDLDNQPYTLFKKLKNFDGAKISKDLNGIYTKEIFKEIKESNPTSEYGKFKRILQLTRTSFFNRMTAFNYIGSDKSKAVIQSNFGNNELKNRLKNTIILNKDYKKVIKQYDSPLTFFYLDPPYEGSGKLYVHSSMPINDIYNVLKNIKGRFLLSYNDSVEAKKLFKNYYINYVTTHYEHTKSIGKRKTKEMLISNYDPLHPPTE